MDYSTYKLNEKEFPVIKSFQDTLSAHNLGLKRDKTHTIQVNTGLLCNQTCLHCHLSAGPHRNELMSMDTINELLAYIERCDFTTMDITGGAPELNPNLPELIKRASALVPRIIVRSNLSALHDGKKDHLISLFKVHNVTVMASFPSLNHAQLESQRGKGLFDISISMLKKLNDLGYGTDSGELELNLISNPSGAFLPSDQSKAEERFHQILERKYGICFTNLYNFANVPIGRFRKWLEKKGIFETYLKKLESVFNPCAVDNLMCRTLVSVSWDGYMYDCDFNLSLGIPMGGRVTHISEMNRTPAIGSNIAVSDHCYTCTAGAGFT